MRLTGLLVAVVAVLLCGGAAEAKRVSRCEMKMALEGSLILPSHWQKFKNLILARVICDAEKRSNLTTGLVKLFSQPEPVSPTSAPTPTTRKPMPTPVSNAAMPTTNTATSGTNRNNTMVSNRTTVSMTTMSPTMSKTPMGSTTHGSRRKRMAEEGNGEDRMEATMEKPLNLTAMENSLEEDTSRNDEAEVVEEDQDKVSDEDDEAEATDNDKEEEADESHEEEQVEDESEEEEEEEEEEEVVEEQEEEEEEEKAEIIPEPRQGERFYGVFQLNDRFHCDSNLQSSWNLCQTNCQAFTDEDIYDDVACFLHSDDWLRRLKHGKCSSLVNHQDFFEACRL